MNSRTRMLILKFISSSIILSTSILVSGCISEEPDMEEQIPDSFQEIAIDRNDLVDEQGRKYSLIENLDGTETAILEEGQEIIFRRDKNSGELELISPKDDSDLVSAGLGFLAGIATSYFLYKGLTPPTGHIVGNRYIPDTQPSIMSLADRQSYYNRYIQDIEDKRRTSGGGAVFSSSRGGSVDLSKSNSSI